MSKKLPPLLGSDDRTLKDNRKDGFYEKRPSDVWGGFRESKKVKKSKECKHFFIKTNDGVECKYCHMGFNGKELVVKNGHVYFGNQKLF